METIMSTNKDKSNLATLEDHDILEDTELNAVSGGKLIDKATPKLYEACCRGTHLPEVTL
jgi:type VI protein secretion system component Hcp